MAGIVRPAIWLAALVFALPFYFSIKLPLLPNRAFSIIDLGIYGGLALIGLRWLLIRTAGSLTGLPVSGATPGATRRIRAAMPRLIVMLLLALIVSWALVASVDARYVGTALREWRTVFINGFLFGLLMFAVLYLSPTPDRDRRVILIGWLAGAAAVASIGLWAYVTGGSAISAAEGVRRIQALYGSANNLALYLDRTVAVSLALVLFLRSPRERILWAVLLIPQLLALLLTFSKGSLLLALPATLCVLGIGGFWMLRRAGRSIRPLVGLIVVGIVVLVDLGALCGC